MSAVPNLRCDPLVKVASPPLAICTPHWLGCALFKCAVCGLVQAALEKHDMGWCVPLLNYYEMTLAGLDAETFLALGTLMARQTKFLDKPDVYLDELKQLNYGLFSAADQVWPDHRHDGLRYAVALRKAVREVAKAIRAYEVAPAADVLEALRSARGDVGCDEEDGTPLLIKRPDIPGIIAVAQRVPAVANIITRLCELRSGPRWLSSIKKGLQPKVPQGGGTIPPLRLPQLVLSKIDCEVAGKLLATAQSGTNGVFMVYKAACVGVVVIAHAMPLPAGFHAWAPGEDETITPPGGHMFADAESFLQHTCAMEAIMLRTPLVESDLIQLCEQLWAATVAFVNDTGDAYKKRLSFAAGQRAATAQLPALVELCRRTQGPARLPASAVLAKDGAIVPALISKGEKASAKRARERLDDPARAALRDTNRATQEAFIAAKAAKVAQAKIDKKKTPKVIRQPSTQPCKDFFYRGACSRGAECRFAHTGAPGGNAAPPVAWQPPVWQAAPWPHPPPGPPPGPPPPGGKWPGQP